VVLGPWRLVTIARAINDEVQRWPLIILHFHVYKTKRMMVPIIHIELELRVACTSIRLCRYTHVATSVQRVAC
jgi:hypothetical protein